MINLRTGTPGACKTLSAVQALSKMLARWEKHPEEARPIFVAGVKDLALPHAPMPVVEWREGGNKPPVMVPDWQSMPDASFVLIDEAQSYFPPRSSAATPPPHVAWLNTHRHRGFDIEVITQHPKLIDSSVRALVGKHQHFRRLFGGHRSYCYEWDACSDGLAGLGSAVGTYFPFPKDAFKWYKSAEVHTKQTFKYPKWLLIPVVGVILGIYAIPKGASVVMNGIAGKSPTAKAAALISPAAGMAAAPGASAAVAAVSAPATTLQSVKQVIAEAVAGPPLVAGCVFLKDRCSCVDVAGRRAKVSDEECRTAALELGGLIPYDVHPRAGGSSLVALSGLGVSGTAAAVTPSALASLSPRPSVVDERTVEPIEVARQHAISTQALVLQRLPGGR